MNPNIKAIIHFTTFGAPVWISSLLWCISIFASFADAQTKSLDIGPRYSIPGTSVISRNRNKITTDGTSRGLSNFFVTSRIGRRFQISVPVSAGSYDVKLGFIESNLCKKQRRVFHVYINKLTKLESYDIFSIAGCRKARVETFTNIPISPLQSNRILIEFSAVADSASISYVKVEASKDPCNPITNNARTTDDHLAHSVPGVYNPVVDRDGDRFETVFMDGRGSHTHFSYGGGSGKIISYRWVIAETNQLLSEKAFFSYRFPLGTTRILLTVIDSICSSHEAETTVTVTSNTQPGQYCYLYQANTNFLLPRTLYTGVRPQIGFLSLSLTTSFPNFPFKWTKFRLRCIFSIPRDRSSTSSRLSLQLGNSGEARVYKGRDLVLDTNLGLVSEPIELARGTTSFEVIYTHSKLLKTPILIFKIDGRIPNRVTHDQSSVLPILNEVKPNIGRLAGGARVRLTGYGLYDPIIVRFGRTTVAAQREGATGKQIFVIAPKASSAGTVPLSVSTTTNIHSNKLTYRYGDECDDVGFESKFLKTKAGQRIPLNQPTSIIIGNDKKIYVGLRAGYIQVISYQIDSLSVTTICNSEIIKDKRYRKQSGVFSKRAILGITVDPRDVIPKPYVAASTLFWGNQRSIDKKNKMRWANGAIERFIPVSLAAKKPKDKSICLVHDKSIVNGLPVSDGDHSVNEIEFTQNGDLLISVGGFTNMGLPAGKLSGLWETFFSGAILIARLSRGSNFNGDIPYTSENMRTARPKPGYSDVGIYATGTRNMFSLTTSRSARFFGVDMGPNCEYGNTSTTCAHYKESLESRRAKVPFFPVRTQIDRSGPTKCRYGPTRGDKLLEIKQNRFYGHPNLQRSAILNSNECAWVDPNTGKYPSGRQPPANYQRQLSLFNSAKTGVIEYTSNHFCGKLRGNLIMSMNSGQGTYRVPVQSNGQVSSAPPYRFIPYSGIRVAENERGDLLFPQYFLKGISVSRPKIRVRSGLFARNALPFRHGRRGGTPVTISGWGFNKEAKVLIGNKVCPIVKASSTEISCTVPPNTASIQLVDVIVRVSQGESVLPDAILYMLV